ncbi:(2Fe-2S) ferredoxin domain-containing protein [Candidatus Gracilibacteria bacterium]|nr:(2Fe-2S) ferredoxin domain-containing protein [Candidatus Gracilibacteria bacterium]
MQEKIIKVCHGRACSERFSSYIFSRLEADRDFYRYPDEIILEKCLCQGRCKEGPVVVYNNDIQIYQNPVKASEILRKKVNEWKNQKNNQK